MTTYYVSPAGSDVTGDGSAGNPWASLTHAISQISAGDEIVILGNSGSPHTYTLTGLGTCPPCTIRGETSTGVEETGTRLVTLDGTGNTHQLTPSQAGSFTIKDLVLDTLSVDAEGALLHGLSGSDVDYALTRVRVVDLAVFSESGITSEIGGLIGTDRNNGGSACDAVLDRCEIAGVLKNGSDGGVLFGVRVGSMALTLRQCAIWIDGADAAALDKVFGEAGIAPTVQNTTIQAATTDVPWGDTTSDTIEDSVISGISGLPSGTNLLTSDPLYVDPGTRDVHLQSTSPAREHGKLL